jgi:hypothetical protein
LVNWVLYFIDCSLVPIPSNYEVYDCFSNVLAYRCLPRSRIVKVVYTLVDEVVMEVVVFGMLVNKDNEVSNAPDNSSVFNKLFWN